MWPWHFTPPFDFWGWHARGLERLLCKSDRSKEGVKCKRCYIYRTTASYSSAPGHVLLGTSKPLPVKSVLLFVALLHSCSSSMCCLHVVVAPCPCPPALRVLGVASFSICFHSCPLLVCVSNVLAHASREKCPPEDDSTFVSPRCSALGAAGGPYGKPFSPPSGPVIHSQFYILTVRGSRYYPL